MVHYKTILHESFQFDEAFLLYSCEIEAPGLPYACLQIFSEIGNRLSGLQLHKNREIVHRGHELPGLALQQTPQIVETSVVLLGFVNCLLYF